MPFYAYNYAVHLLAALGMVTVFAVLYTRITPYDELKLIRQGSLAAALSLVGALLGFALTVASSIVHNDQFQMFCIWSAGAMVVQLAAYFVISRLVPELRDALAANNQAVGALLGGVSLTLGILNAACLS